MMTVAQSILKALALWQLIWVVHGSRHAFAFIARSNTPISTSINNRCKRSHRTRGALRSFMAIDPNNNKNDDNNDDSSLDEKLNSFLDKPLFDPDAPSNDNNWFANLVKNDYDSAEALYVGAIVIFGVIVSQELLRIVKYGGGYTPFSSGGGKLF